MPPRRRVAVCMAVRDGMPFLPAAVASILAQSWEDFVLLVVDDGSADGSLAYLRSHPDRRLRVIAQEATGLGAALNRCLADADADYIVRMDADDVSRPARIASQLAFMDARPEVVASGSWIEYFADGGRRTLIASLPLTHEGVVRALLGGGHGLCHPAMIIRTEAARAVGGYRVSGPGQLCDFALRLARIGALANSGEVLLAKRVHPGAVSWRSARTVAVAEREASRQWRCEQRGSGRLSAAAARVELLAARLRAGSQVAYRRALVAYLRGRTVAAVGHATLASLLDPRSLGRRLRRELVGA